VSATAWNAKSNSLRGPSDATAPTVDFSRRHQCPTRLTQGTLLSSAFVSSWPSDGPLPRVASSDLFDDARPRELELVRQLDIRQEVEVFLIFVHPAVAFTDGLLRLDEANLTNPFDHFEAELIFNA